MTKLQCFASSSVPITDYNPLMIDSKSLPFSQRADQVRIVRSTEGNESAILDRISAHRKALSSVLYTCIAKGHRANPVIGIKVEKVYAAPVLLSGLGALVLTKKDIDTIDHHFQQTLLQLLRLHNSTPCCVIFFFASCMPGAALIHMRQLSLFSMICRLDPKNLLYQYAQNFFTSAVSFKGSWFLQIQNWCLLYQLPHHHPSDLIKHPLPKNKCSSMVKKNVICF